MGKLSVKYQTLELLSEDPNKTYDLPSRLVTYKHKYMVRDSQRTKRSLFWTYYLTFDILCKNDKAFKGRNEIEWLFEKSVFLVSQTQYSLAYKRRMNTLSILIENNSIVKETLSKQDKLVHTTSLDKRSKGQFC